MRGGGGWDVLVPWVKEGRSLSSQIFAFSFQIGVELGPLQAGRDSLAKGLLSAAACNAFLSSPVRFGGRECHCAWVALPLSAALCSRDDTLEF